MADWSGASVLMTAFRPLFWGEFGRRFEGNSLQLWCTFTAMTVPHATRQQATHWPPRGPARVLVVLDRTTMIELIKMTLNHGVYTTRTATTANDVATALSEWQPHLAILDMDLDGLQILNLLEATPVGGTRLPVIGLTRRGDRRPSWRPSRRAWTTS